MEQPTTALIKRSLRNLRSELEFLVDTKAITSQQYSAIVTQLSSQRTNTDLSNPLSTPVQNPLPALAAAQQNESSFNEKQPDYFAPPPSAAVPPPAYAPSVEPPILASASALYQYVPSDTGDLAILPDDRIVITEFMNADWAKGRNERSGQWGIFPRSYVRVLDGKSVSSAPPPATPTSYGNMPLDVSHGGGAGAGGAGGGNESKLNQTGKKFGKKMGNAAIFGAGATIGSNIVNGIF